MYILCKRVLPIAGKHLERFNYSINIKIMTFPSFLHKLFATVCLVLKDGRKSLSFFDINFELRKKIENNKVLIKRIGRERGGVMS